VPIAIGLVVVFLQYYFAEDTVKIKEEKAEQFYSKF
jgi:hypothetical protein